MKNKKSINELSAASRWVDSFFDALKSNTANRMLAKAKQVNMDPRIVSQLEKIQKEKEELDKLMGIK
jgi:hypothetical protein